jgi:hypothetical protein
MPVGFTGTRPLGPASAGPAHRSGAVSIAPQCGLHTRSNRAQWPLIKSRSARSHDVGAVRDGQGTVVVPVSQPVEQDVSGDQG